MGSLISKQNAMRDTADESRAKSLDIDELITTINLAHVHSQRLVSEQSEQCCQTSKETEEAVKWRIIGNKYFVQGKDDEALEFYTMSVCFAMNDSEELALAYANRSAVLNRNRKYVPCLLDMNRALDGNYPWKLRQKLLVRKKRCLLQIKKMSKNNEQPYSIKGDETDLTVAENNSTDNVSTEWQNMCNFCNPLLPNTSQKVKLACNEKWGRYLVASEDIEPGEILSSQEFFVAMLALEKPLKYCSHCFSRCYALVPCSSCSDMVYCSKQCLDEANNAYHQIECKLFARSCAGERVEIWERLAVRALLIGTKQGTRLNDLMEQLTERDIFKENIDSTDIPFVNDYLSFLKLYAIFKTSSASVEQYVPTAVKTIVALQRLNFFHADTNDQSGVKCCLSKEELFATMLLLNHLVLMESYIMNKSTESEIGRGVCIPHTLINHSCDPNTQLLARYREQVLMACRPIKKGEQIFVSYCNTFSNVSKTTRIQKLSQFGFTCRCEACINDWPVGSDLQKLKTEFFTSRDEVITYVNKNILPVIQKGTAGLSNQKLLQVICDLCKWLHVNVKKPSIAVQQCEMLLTVIMELSYTSSQEYMKKFQKGKSVETYLSWLVKDMLE